MIDTTITTAKYVVSWRTRLKKSGMLVSTVKEAHTLEQYLSLVRNHTVEACEEDRDVSPFVVYVPGTPLAAAAAGGFDAPALPEPTVEPGRVRVKKEKKPKT